jgi:outer membrane lipoprotein
MIREPAIKMCAPLHIEDDRKSLRRGSRSERRPNRPVHKLAFALAALLAAGCATSPDACRAPVAGDLTPAGAAASAPVGRAVTWGGTLIEARNLADATELEILAYPLDDCGRPRTGQDSVGRFIALRPGYLETAELRPGREITASGRLIATREGSIGGTDYRFPVVEDANPRIWPRDSEAGGRYTRPRISIGVGAGSGWSGGGVGVSF